MGKKILYYKNFIAGAIIILITISVAKDIKQKHQLAMKKLGVKKQELAKGKESVLKWQVITSEIDKLAKNFFSKDTSQFRTFVEQQAKIAGININSISPANKEKDFYWESTVNIKGNCAAYANITKFLSSLESKNINVESLHIKAAAKKRTIDAVLKAFVMKK
jgi:hypothetical protein